MIKTVYVPLGVKYPNKMTGDNKISGNLEALQRLDRALDAGFNVVGTCPIDHAQDARF